MGRLEAVVKVTILFLLWSGNFKVDLLCEPCFCADCAVKNRF